MLIHANFNHGLTKLPLHFEHGSLMASHCIEDVHLDDNNHSTANFLACWYASFMTLLGQISIKRPRLVNRGYFSYRNCFTPLIWKRLNHARVVYALHLYCEEIGRGRGQDYNGCIKKKILAYKWPQAHQHIISLPLTHWPLRDAPVTLKISFLNLFHRLMSWWKNVNATEPIDGKSKLVSGNTRVL